MTLLNKGLNYAITTSMHTTCHAWLMEQTIIDIESAIQTGSRIEILSKPEEAAARNEAAKISKETNHGNQHNKGEIKILEKLKEKPVFYMKADSNHG